MKVLATTVLQFAAALQLLTVARAPASTFFMNLQDDNGDTRVSVSWSADMTSTGIPAPYVDWVGIGGLFPAAISGGGSPNYIYGLGSFIGYVDTLPGFGTFKDLTTGTTASLNLFVAIPNYAGAGSTLDFRFDTDLGNAVGDIIQYSPGVDSATVAIPFSSFSPGTYEVSPQQPIGMVLTVEPIPEPSSGLLTVLGAVCVVLAGLRRAAVPNQSRQPTPGERLGSNRTPLARRGCAHRYGHESVSNYELHY